MPVTRVGRPARAALVLAAALALALAGFVRLDTVPAPFWDEGWTLLTARNWVERGHYGQLRDGRPRPAGLSADLPVVAPIAAAFRILGVGYWQGRIAGVGFAAGALALLWTLARALEGPGVAWGTLAAALLLTYPDPLTVGRHALAEMPAMFYLVAGYALAVPALRGRWLCLLPASLAWTLALAAKAQVTPFWLVSIVGAVTVALARRSYGMAAGLAAAGGAAWAGRHAVAWLYRLLLGGLSEASVEGLYEVSAAVTAVHARSAALQLLVAHGALPVLAVAWGGWRLLRTPAHGGDPAERPVLRAALWGLAASWLAWYALLAPAWSRYLFPPAFLAAPLVGRLLVDAVHGLGRPGPAGGPGGLMARLRTAGAMRLVGAVAVLALAGSAGARTVAEHALAHADTAGRNVHRAAGFLNRHAPPDARIETYDPELMFLLDRRYHYPPDQVHVALNRRLFLDPETPVRYDPLATDPDYLVVGPLPRLWRLYDGVLATRAFRPLARFGDYLLFERVRP